MDRATANATGIGSLLAWVALASASPAAPPPADFPFDSAGAKAHQQAWATFLKRPAITTNSVGMSLVLIPPGKFEMGSPAAEKGHTPSERQHPVTLTKAFYLAATEVTQAQWVAVMGKNPSFCPGDTLPVDTVAWEDAMEFCRRLSARESATYRLPTEAEWEYACRAGTTTPFHTGATISTAQANFDGRSVYGGGKKGPFREESTPAGSLAANVWGLYDLHGNVWEWCADWFGDYPAGAVTDPVGPPQGEKRVVRGGCWIVAPVVCRSANRGSTVPQSWNFHFGFRVVRALE